MAAECSEFDGKQRGLGARHLGHEDVARRDQAFLVGKRGERALPHGLERRLQPRRADDRRHDPVGGPARGLEQRLLPCPDLDAGAGKRCAQSGVALRIGDHGKLGAMQDGELGEASGVLAAGQRDDPIGRGSRPIRSSVLSPIEPVAPRTEMRRGGLTALRLDLDAERCEGWKHVASHQISRPRPGLAGSRSAIRAASDGGKQKAVDAVEQAAMTWDQLAHVLGSEAALHRSSRPSLPSGRRAQARCSRAQASRPKCSLSAEAKATPTRAGVERADDKPAPGLVGRDAGRELGPADQASGDIRGRIGGPGNGKKIEHGDGAKGGIAAEPHQRQRRKRGISEARERPAAPAGSEGRRARPLPRPRQARPRRDRGGRGIREWRPRQRLPPRSGQCRRSRCRA